MEKRRDAKHVAFSLRCTSQQEVKSTIFLFLVYRSRVCSLHIHGNKNEAKDSVIRGFNNTAAFWIRWSGCSPSDNYCRKADVLLRGYGGCSTRWALFLLYHIFPLNNPKRPVATTLFFGANDAALLGRTSERQYVPVEEYRDNLRKSIWHLKVCNPTMIVMLITPPSVDEEERMQYAKSLYGERAMELSERTNEMTGVYARQRIELSKELGVLLVDLWSKMQETEGWQKKFLSDGLHLTPEGNAVVYQEVVRNFNEAGLSSEEMPCDFPHHSQIDGKNPEKAFQQQQCSSDSGLEEL